MCTTEANLDLIIVGTRALVLLMCTLFAGISIILGARMYQTAVSSKSHAELSAMGVRLVLKSAGPGLCLIGFGAVLLALLVLRPAVLTDTIAEPAQAEKKASPSSQSFRSAPSTVSAAKLLLVGNIASAPAADTKKCVLIARKREFSTGQDPLAPSRIKQNIQAAIQGIERAGDAGIQNPLQRAAIVAGLREIERAADETQE